MAKTFIEEFSSRNNLLIVDGLNLAFRYKHMGRADFADNYYDTVNSLANSYKARDIIVLGDMGSSWRKSIYPAYKANRDELRAKQTEQEAKDFTNFLEEVGRAMSRFEISFKFKGVEADDIAGYIVKNHRHKYDHVWLISTDGDWDLLLNDNVSRFSYVTRKEYTLDNWDDTHNVAHDQFMSLKCIMGDKGDNIPNATGVGEKRATAILDKYGDVFDVYDSIPLSGSQAFIKNLNAFKEQLMVNVQLIDILTFCEEAIGEDNCKHIDKVMEEINESLN